MSKLVSFNAEAARSSSENEYTIGYVGVALYAPPS